MAESKLIGHMEISTTVIYLKCVIASGCFLSSCNTVPFRISGSILEGEQMHACIRKVHEENCPYMMNYHYN